MEIHKKGLTESKAKFIFTKDKNNCLIITYDKDRDYGENSASGANEIEVEIHYNNSYIKNQLERIKISDVPKTVIDILTYLA